MMNAKLSFVVASVALGIVAAGCSSAPAKTDAEERKAFLGSAMPKGFMKNMGGAQAAGDKAAKDAAAKAALANVGK